MIEGNEHSKTRRRETSTETRKHENVVDRQYERHGIEEEVPSPIDLRDPAAAREWEQAADARPGRAEMFQAFGHELSGLSKDGLRVLELGSGPGFLAAFLLDALPAMQVTLLDISAAMHDLARARLGQHATRASFVERSFGQSGWSQELGLFDAVITNQAVHELRHKSHAVQLHAEVV